MDEVRGFDYINSTYYQMFGLTQLDSFLKRRPSDGILKWKLKNLLTYFSVLFSSIWIGLVSVGVYYDREAEPEVVSFTISGITFLIIETVLTAYFVVNVDEFRPLILQFELFQTSKHRPFYSRAALQEKASMLRKVAKTCNGLVCATIAIYLAVPLGGHALQYVLKEAGLASSTPENPIPRIFPYPYPFELESVTSRLIFFAVDVIFLLISACYTIPLHLFFVSMVMMISAQLDLICKSAFTAEELCTSLEGSQSISLKSGDNRNSIDIKLLIQDHQKILQITNTIRKVMSPILGFEMCNIIIAIATMAFSASTQMKTANSMIEGLQKITGPVASIAIVMSILFLYSWTCGKLKESEESVFDAVYSASWPEKDKAYRQNLIIIMSQSLKSKPIKMFAIGHMGREIFINGIQAIYSYYSFFTKFQ